MTGTIEKFEKLMQLQAKFQELVTKEIPHDDPSKFEYHIAAIVEELGEVLKADKRWKTHRNAAYIPSEKLDELSDVLITVMNLCLWSGLVADDILTAVENKIDQNFSRIGAKTCS